MLNLLETYSRKNQILFDSKGNKVLRFIDPMPDGKDFSGELIVNMNKYIRCYPERVEVIDSKKEESQLSFF